MNRIIIILILLTLLPSCRVRREYVEVPVEVVHKEYINTTKVDSIFVKDSVDRYISGDTVYLYKERVKYQYLYKTDTIIQVDSIPKIIKQVTTEQVEVNKVYWWQRVLIWLGGFTAIIGTIYITRIISLKRKW